MIILNATEEDQLIAESDGTCNLGDACRVLVDLCQNTAGKSIQPGMMCVMCCRWYATNCWLENKPLEEKVYRNYHDEYDKEYFVPLSPNIGITFPIIRYDAELPLQIHTSIFRKLFHRYQYVPKGIEAPTPWNLMYCEKCNRVCNSIDRKFSIGFDNVLFDLESGKKICSKCKQQTCLKPSDRFGNVLYDTCAYSRCYICNTVTTCEMHTIQICKICNNSVYSILDKSNKRCYYCDTVLNDKKKFTMYNIKENNEVTQVFLCKIHTISRRVLTKFKKMYGGGVFDKEVFFAMMSHKRRSGQKRKN